MFNQTSIMNKFKFYGCLGILAASFTFCACGDDDDNGKETEKNDVTWSTDGGIKACDHILFTADGDANVNDNGRQIGNGDQEFVFTGKQTIKKGTYILKGWVYIADGAELTIEPGTIIKGDKQTKASLIAERGGKLIAQGTAQEPIVFTSEEAKGNRRPGDWGGVILCGKAVNNNTEMQIEGGPRTKHGGSDNSDNSGVLSYVRIEFAGYPFQTDQEINGLTLGSIGSGTKIDHVSYSNDDSYEWFGGTVDCKYLVAYRGWDDDFDTDNGFSGNVQFALSVRDSKIADTSQSNGFESDNNGEGSATSPFTSCVFSNVTFVGPVGQDAAFSNTSDYITAGDMNPKNGSKLGQFQSAMQVRRNSHLNCFNSVAMGFPVGLIVENDKGSQTQTAASEGTLKIQNVYMAGMTVLGSDVNKSFEDGFCDNGDKNSIDKSKESFSSTYFKSIASNKYFDAIADLKLSQPNSLQANPNYGPLSDSPLRGAASFTDPLVANGFDEVTYIGAFADENDGWMSGWTEFDPQNKAY